MRWLVRLALAALIIWPIVVIALTADILPDL